jgi:hypothetical protein
MFTPTALYLEAEERSGDAPNAMRLTKDQVTEALARLSPVAKAIAIAFAKTEDEKSRIKEQAIRAGEGKPFQHRGPHDAEKKYAKKTCRSSIRKLGLRRHS